MDVARLSLVLFLTGVGRSATAQDSSMPMLMPTMAMPGMTAQPSPHAATPLRPQADAPPPDDGNGSMAGMRGGDHAGMAMSGMAMSGGMAMQAALGPHPMNREASGTSWQPDASPHQAIETMRGGWMLMAHGMVNLVYDSQSGPRGGARTRRLSRGC